MRRPDLDVWAGIVMALLFVATGVPVLLAQRAGSEVTAGPPWLWWTAYAGFLVGFLVSSWASEAWGPPRSVVAFSVPVVLGPVVVLLAPGGGWTPILLVFTAALSAYIVGRRVTAGIVVGNTAVAMVGPWIRGGEGWEIVLTGVLYLLIQIVSVLGVVGEQRERAARRALAEAHTELRATSTLLADTSRAAERLRIARDLHDVIGHQVTALALELEVASHHSTPPAAEHVSRSRAIAKDLLANLRSTVGQLRDETPELGPALERVVADLPDPQVHLRVDDGLQVDEARRTALVRCVQEIVTNAIRHAEAENLWIDVAAGPDGGTVLSARDDGRGTRELTPGNGLTGLRERVEGLGGHAAFSSNGGFHVVATVPAP